VLRPFLSLLVASIATALGLAALLIAGQRHVVGLARLSPDPGSDVLMLVGVLLLGVAAASLAVHWVGALVVGAVHLLLGGLAVLIPISGPLSGAYNPTWEISGMLRDLDPSLGDGSTVFFYSGAALALGAFLVGAALGVRSRWDSPPAGASVVVVSSLIGGGVLLVALVLLATAGDEFVTDLLVMLRYEFAFALAVVVAALLAGIGGLTSRWSSAGVILIGIVAVVAGVVAILAGAALPFELVRPKVVAYGFLPALGISFLAAGIAAKLRAPADPVETEAL
jgi:hypothetical protein